MKDDRIMTANGSIVGAVKVSSNAQDHPNFINDKLNDRVLVIEGFLFNPGEEKRNSLQELEWLISDFKIRISSLYNFICFVHMLDSLTKNILQYIAIVFLYQNI